MSSEITALPSTSVDNATFDQFVHAMQAHFNGVLERNGRQLFTVETDVDLFALYLSALPRAERQYHTCHCCKEFIRRFGSLASVNKDGSLESAVWTDEDVPELYREAGAVLAEVVKAGKINGVALFTTDVWGTPQAGKWTHFAVQAPANLVYRRSGTTTAGQAMAAKLEDHRTLMHGLAEFDQNTVAQALTLLRAEAFDRSEKVIGPAEFLFELHKIRSEHRGRNRENLIWLRVAGAPVGFCQPRSSVIGTLLEDIAAKLDFEDVKRRFNSKLDPLLYRRPQAAPTAGNIARAEKLFQELGLASALERRFARLDEIKTIWQPKVAGAKPASAAGIFDHLQPKNAQPRHQQPYDMTPRVITWHKFAATVLPDALSIEVFMERNMNLGALVTATVPEAPCILQWDSEEERNPFSGYVYHLGSSPEQWGLNTGSWVSVTAAALQPSMWSGEDRFPHLGKGAILILKGARDTRNGGLALFPETLRSSLNEVRATIEAHSKSRRISGGEEASANGLFVGKDGNSTAIRVTSSTGVVTYKIDRWD